MTAPQPFAAKSWAGKLGQINNLVKQLLATAKFTAPVKKVSATEHPELLR